MVRIRELPMLDTELILLGRPFLKPFIHGFLRACRREDRALYSHELLVHGKDRTNHSARFKGLLKEFNVGLLT